MSKAGHKPRICCRTRRTLTCRLAEKRRRIGGSCRLRKARRAAATAASVVCERRKRIERRHCCRFHRFLRHLRQSISKKPSCRAGRRALAECYTFFRFGAGFDDRRVVVWNPMPWRVICCAVRKCGRCSVAARAEVRAKLWEYGKRESAPGRPTGQSFQKTRRSGSAAKDRQTSSCCGCVSERSSRRPKGLPRANPADATRALCVRLHTKPYGGRIFGLLCGGKIASSAGCRAREKCCKIFTRCIMSVGKAAEPQCRAVAGAAFPLRLMEAGGFILRAAASDAFVVPPHFQSGILSGRACPALGFAVRRPMFRSKAAVHRASSMRIRKPANALAGKRPKHRRAKPRQRWPRPARDGRRG